MLGKRSILNKLILNGFVTVIISFLIAGTILFTIATSTVEIANEEKLNMLTLNAQRISEFSTNVFSQWSPLSENYKRTLNTIAESIDAHIVVFDSNSNVVAVGGLDEGKYMWNRLSGEYVTKILSGETVCDRSEIKLYGDSNMLTVGMPVAGKISYGGVLVSAPSVSKINAFSDILKQYGLSAVIALIIAFLLFYILSKRIIEPIKLMNNAVKDFSKGDFKKRVNLSTKDELETLAKNINDMAESIENLEEMRSGFISSVSHELRTPMTSISGFVEGMLDGTIPEDEHKKYLEIVQAECRRLSKLVDDLLKISRLENNKLTINKTSFDINELLRLGIIKFEKEITEKNIEISAEFEKDDTLVFADADQITQVITNILHNAVKFTFEGGKILIKTFEKDGKINVLIKNTGNGISEDKIKYIFDRFYKTDSSRSENPDGVGLGLYIVKNILNQHGEEITDESKENEYTLFTFTLSKPSSKS